MEPISNLIEDFIFFSSDENDLSLQPWQELVRHGIQKQAYHYTSPQTYSSVDDFRENVEKKVAADAEKSLDRHPKVLVHQIFQKDQLAMSGIAILATYLRVKKGIDNLFVCKSLEAFQKKLDEISCLKKDIRLALVMTDWPEIKEEQAQEDEEYRSALAHKLVVCLEKKGPQIKIGILDPMGIDDDDISPARILASASDLKFALMSGIDAILWYIYHSSLNMEQTSVYYSKVRRQKTLTGCETFALTDGLSFLRDPHFFENLRAQRLLFKEGKAELKLYKIKLLPPDFMCGTQSLKLLKKYTQKNPTLPSLFHQKIAKHLVEVDGKLQNHSINHKSMKYHLIVAAALEKITTKGLQQIIHETLLTTPRLPLGNAPQTLSDIHHFKPDVMIEEI